MLPQFAQYYYCRDYLGNNVAVWNAETKQIEQLTMYYIIGLPMNNSTGDNLQAYKYNNKELITQFGLNEYDNETRYYYPAIGRTTTIDPLCEKYYHISPYAWCGNNPIKYVDPDGRDTLHFDAKGNYTHRVQSEGSHVGLWHKSNNSTREFRFQDPNDANRFMTSEEYENRISNGETSAK